MNVRPVYLGILFALVASAGIASCSDSGSKDPKPTVRVSGVVRDWRTGAAIADAFVETIGITPIQSAISEGDGTFSLQAVPINGFILLRIDAAAHVRTISPAILVEEDNLDDVLAESVATADATAFETAFAITTSAGHGVVLGRTQSPALAGIPGVSELRIVPLGADFDGPYFLDANGSAAVGGTETTSDGGFLFFNVSSGDIAVQGSATNLAFETQATVVAEDVYSLVTLPGDGPGVGGSPTPTPSGTPGPQSFATDIVPIFTARGCTGSGCHRPPTNGGGLRLNQSADQIYPAVVARCNTADPPNSLLLIKPLFEASPNHTGGNVFLTNADPDYQKMLRWITDGAPQN